MALPELTTENFISTIESSPIPVLVLFGAEWCAPCKRLKSILDQAVPLLAGKVSIRYVDCDESYSLTKERDVRGLPTLALYDKGKEVQRKIGILSLKEVLSLVDHETILPVRC